MNKKKKIKGRGSNADGEDRENALRGCNGWAQQGGTKARSESMRISKGRI